MLEEKRKNAIKVFVMNETRVKTQVLIDLFSNMENNLNKFSKSLSEIEEILKGKSGLL